MSACLYGEQFSVFVGRCCGVLSISVFFFFQAEDGIRDLVRSRGLGDVYKRQDLGGAQLAAPAGDAGCAGGGGPAVGADARGHGQAVSYTHLTLPTSDLV